MYEPIYIPQISNTLLPLAGVRFGITHSKERKSPDDPGVDLLHIHDCTELYFHIEGKASFMINGVLESAQEAAQQYLDNLQEICGRQDIEYIKKEIQSENYPQTEKSPCWGFVSHRLAHRFEGVHRSKV